MEKLKVLENKGIIGMIHCLPLPGTLHYGGSMQAVIDRALADLDALEKAGVDAAIVDTVVTSDGIVNPCAKELLRYRKLLDAQEIALLCDIQTKHTFMLCDSISIEESARMAEDSGADAIIITGAHTGSSTPLEVIRQVRNVTRLPLVAGSGVTADNLPEQFRYVDAAIVGSAMKAHGKAEEPIDYELARRLMDKANSCRG